MKKKVMRNLALALAAALILVLLPVMPTADAAAPTTSWESTVSGSFVQKSTTLTEYTISTYIGNVYSTNRVTIDTNETLGSEKNPYAISSEAELILFGQQTSAATSGKYYILDKPDGVYDMRGDEGYYMLPLFKSVLSTASGLYTVQDSFKGTLIGNNAVIKNANIGDYSATATGYISGLFSAIQFATVCDLILSDITLYVSPDVYATGSSPQNGAGALAGNVISSGVLNCHVSGVSYENINQIATDMGGLVGCAYGSYPSSYIVRCSVKAVGTDVRAYSYGTFGGIVGQIGTLTPSSTALIESCTVNWEISVNSGSYVGGIVGNSYDSTVNNCSHIGKVSSKVSGYVGGIAGRNNGGTVKNSFQHGDVTISASSGIAYAGGVVGDNSNSCKIENCYQNGAVTVTGSASPAYSGGIAGRNSGDGAVISNSYHVGDVSAAGGTSGAGGLVGISATYNNSNSVSYSYYEASSPDSSSYRNAIGCGTFVSAANSFVTLFNDYTGGSQSGNTTPTYVPAGTPTTLLAALNGWVAYNSGYASWASDTNNINGGYPILQDVGVEMPKIVTVVGAGTGGATSGAYFTGTTITLNAGTKPGYDFAGWTSSDVIIDNPSSSAASFVMLGNDVMVTANWSKLPDPPSGGGYTPPSLPGYSFIGGNTYIQGSVQPLILTINKDFSLFGSVRMDGSALTRDKQYKAESGSTVITVFSDYLDTLAVGKHRLEVYFIDGISVSAEFMIEEWANPFEDVKESDWYYGDVEYAYLRGLMTGTSAKPMLFSPEMPITRGMIVTILYRLEGSPAVGDAALGVPPFSDVVAGEWYYDAVKWAAGNGIVEGYDGKFSPDSAITRQDLAVILLRYMDYSEIEYTVSEEYRFFADEDAIAPYAKNAVQILNKLDILRGKGGDIIDPLGTATRAEAAAMLHRMLVAEQGE